MDIRNIYGDVLFSAEADTVRELVEMAVRHGVSLAGANLSGANLHYAYLSDADLSGANLCGADLRGASLYGASLYGASLYGTYLRGANLYGANLYGANLDAEAVTRTSIVPEVGAFVAFKKAHTDDGPVVLKLQIPGGAARVGGLVGRKCRAERATVLEVLRLDGERWENPTATLRSSYDSSFTYTVGADVLPDKWDGDPRVECTHGIHFFLTFLEAKEYHG